MELIYDDPSQQIADYLGSRVIRCQVKELRRTTADWNVVPIWICIRI